MEGYEAFKELRENAGYSTRQFSKAAGIGLSTLVYYSNGNKSLLNLPVKKVIRIFSLLQYSVDLFYNTYYSNEIDVSDKIIEWRKENPREYNIRNLQNRMRMRIFKLKERERISEDVFGIIEKQCRHTFEKLSVVTDGTISDKQYEEYIIPLKGLIETYMENELPKEDNSTAVKINDCIINTDYSYKNLAEFIGITNYRLSKCKTSDNGYDDMQIGTAMRICNVFHKRFEDLFI